MNQAELQSILEVLETFIVLKKQNLIIYAWMEFKKISKRITGMRNSRANSSYNVRVQQQNHYLMPHKVRNNFETFRCITPNYSTLKPRLHERGKRLVTENYIPNHQYMFQTFNRDKHQNQNTLTEKNVSQYPKQHQNEDIQFEDSDQFEDIVLDRLSKLQESVNKIMNEKKVKEENRGIIGAPIANPHFYNKNKTIQYPYNLNNQSFDNRQQSNDIKNRKKRFYQSLQSNQPNGKIGDNIVYNLKYIPVSRQSQPVNLSKIREIIQKNNDQQQDDLIGGVQYFNQNNIRQTAKWNTNQRPYFTINKIGERSVLQNQAESKKQSRQKWGSNTLYMNRYEPIFQKNQIHYVPDNIQIQSAIQDRKKYVRNQKLIKDPNNDLSFNGRQKSGVGSQISRTSNRSNRTFRAHNLSSYY